MDLTVKRTLVTSSQNHSSVTVGCCKMADRAVTQGRKKGNCVKKTLEAHPALGRSGPGGREAWCCVFCGVP